MMYLNNKSIDYLTLQSFCEEGELSNIIMLAESVTVDTYSFWIKWIKFDDYRLFRLATVGGHLPILIWFENNHPELLLEMIRAGNYALFYTAAQYGQIAIMDWCGRHAPEEISKMISADEFRAFGSAANHHHIKVLEWIAKRAPINEIMLSCRTIHTSIIEKSTELREYLFPSLPSDQTIY